MGSKLADRIKAPAIGFKVGDNLPIASIRTDGGTQARAGLNPETLEEYAAAMQDNAVFPLIIVYHSGEDYWLADGFHRVAAARLIGRTELRAEVRQGDRRAAILYAVGANDAHGLRRTNADKRRAITALLEDDEWKTWSDSAIAKQVKVDHKTVASVRAELVATGEIPGSSLRQSADGKLRDVAGIREANASRTQPKIPEPTPALPDVARFGFTVRALPDGWIGLRSPGDLESQHTAAHLAALISTWDTYPPIPADLAAAGVTWRYRTERGYYQVMIGDGIGPTGYTPDELFETTRDRMRRLGGLPAVQPTPTPTPDPPADDAAFGAIVARWAALGYQLRVVEAGRYVLFAPDGSSTANMQWHGVLSQLEAHERKVIKAEQPAAQPTNDTPDTPQMQEWWDIKARWAALGWALGAQGEEHYRITPSAGGVGITNMSWYSVVSRLEAQERKAIEAQVTMPAEPSALRATIPNIPAPGSEPPRWWNCGIQMRAIERAVNHQDRAGALDAARQLVALFEEQED